MEILYRMIPKANISWFDLLVGFMVGLACGFSLGLLL